MTKRHFHGSITALITPFADGAVDEAGFQKFVEWQIAQGTHGLVPCGTTGEASTLSHEEQQRVTELCIQVARGRVPVMAGCGSNATDEAIRLTQHAQKSGADAALHVLPYYNKPTQEGIYQHFKAIHDNSDIPIFIYNVPGRTVIGLAMDTLARLAQLPRIAGIKDATADLTRPAKTRLACGTDFVQLSGEDATILPFLAHGGHGCISVTSNIAPALCASFHNAIKTGATELANKINDQLLPVHDAMFCETSPGPVKFAAARLGLCRYEFRLPMVPISKANEATVEAALINAGLLQPTSSRRVAGI